MKMLLFYLLLFQSFLFSYDDNISLLMEMFEQDGWVVENKHSDSLTVFKKKLDGPKIPAFKATMISSIPIDYIMEAVLDGENHEEFMGSSHVVESEFIGASKADTTYSYQMLDLPIISDRHYITTNFNDTLSNYHYRMNWMVDKKKNIRDFSDFIDKKNEKHGKPIFVEDGVGSWELKYLDDNKTEVSYYVLINPGGWIPNSLVTYVNKSLGPNTVIMMVKEGERRYSSLDEPRHILFTLKPDVDNLIIEKLRGRLVVRNNIDIQILINMYGFKSIEKWLPSAGAHDISGDINLSKVYRIDIGPGRLNEIDEIRDGVNALPGILNAEVQYPRQYLKKARK